MTRYLINLLLSILIVFSGCDSQAQPPNRVPTPNDSITPAVLDSALNPGLEKSALRVGVKMSEPFVTRSNKEIEGISIDLWEHIADQIGLEYEYIVFDELPNLLQAIGEGEVDISINPLTVTGERLQIMEFTQPFFVSNLSIAVKNPDDGQLVRFLKNMFSWNFIAAISLLSLVILIFGAIVWLFERKNNDEHFANNARGLWDAFWWSAVTMTTVGYGDRSPKTTGGRIVAIIWMFAAIIIISGYTASIASSLTVNELSLKINSVEDLKKVKIITVRGSSAETYMQISKLPYEVVESPKEGLQFIEDGGAEAFVYDEPILRYHIRESDLEEDIYVAPAKFFTQYYGFAVPPNSPHLQAINLSLVQEIKTMEWKAFLGRYQLD